MFILDTFTHLPCPTPAHDQVKLISKIFLVIIIKMIKQLSNYSIISKKDEAYSVMLAIDSPNENIKNKQHTMENLFASANFIFLIIENL